MVIKLYHIPSNSSTLIVANNSEQMREKIKKIIREKGWRLKDCYTEGY